MYTPDIYRNEDPESIRAFLKKNSFGILINQTHGKLCATHIPIELEINSDGKEILQGHISKLNPQAEGFTENDQVLAVFSGPHSYISNSENPVRVEDLSAKTMRQVKGIFGFEIEISEIQATKKLSQSRDDHNYKNIISELEKTKNPQSIALAKEMLKCRK